MFGDLLGGGLILISNGEKWKRQRELLMNGFHQNDLAVAVDEVARRTTKYLSRVPLGQPFDVQEEFQHLTFDVMCYYALGAELDEVDTRGTGQTVSELWYGVLDHTTGRFIAPFHYWDYITTPGVRKYNLGMKLIRGLINKSIDRELANPSPSAKGRSSVGHASLLSYMVEQHRESPQDMTRQDIMQQALTFLFAGHDTTSNLAAFMAYHIGKDPKIKAQCVAEVDELFAGKGPEDLLTMKEVKSARYLRMVAKETLRLFPGAPVRGRILREADQVVEGLTFPESFLFIDFLSVHLNPEFWPNPEVFDPERFSEERERDRPQHHFLAFGSGPRRCIGEQFAMNEAVTIIAVLLRHHDLVTVPDQVIQKELVLTMKSKNGIMVSITKRAQ